MTERLVFNTGPLITLDRIGCLDVVAELPFDCLAPAEVRAELDIGEACGYPRIAPDWLSVKSLASPPTRLGLAGLDGGEAAVIELALQEEVQTVAIDEWKGRRAALAAGLSVTGTLGILGRAKRLGVVPALRPLIERALAEGVHYHPDLVRAVLEAAGE